MSNKHKKSPSANQNWITEETFAKYRNNAKKLAEIHQQFESEHEFFTVRKDAKTVVLKMVKQRSTYCRSLRHLENKS